MKGFDKSSTQIIEHFGFGKENGYSINCKQIKGNIAIKEIESNLVKLNIKDYGGSLRFRYFKDNKFNENLEDEPLYLLWHLFYSVNKEEDIVKKLTEKKFVYKEKEEKAGKDDNKENKKVQNRQDGDILFNLFEVDKEQAVFLSRNIKFSKSYGNLSTKAIKRLIPFMAQGMHYDKACEAVAEKNESLSQYRKHKETKVEKKEKKILLDKLEPIKTNSLRSPVVEKVMNQVISLVNEIINNPDLVTKEERENGKFEIRIELARELKNSAEKRAKMTKENSTRQKANEEAILRIKEQRVPNPSIGDMEKYKLWKECNVCPYTGQCINIEDLFAPGRIEVEHIFPKSKIFDDSFLNKTLAPKDVNNDKGNMTAYEYMNSSRALITFEAYTCIVNKHYQGAKQKRLLAAQIPDNFIQRQLKETQYINKKLVEHLELVCHNVYTTTGQITDYLKHQWGLTEILMRLNIEKYREKDHTKIKTEVIVNKHTGKIINDSKEYIESYRKKVKPKDKKEEVEKEEIENVDEISIVEKIEEFERFGKRDDHRHHALDALVIALTKQSHIQQLNSLNKNADNFTDLKKSTRLFPVPITIPFKAKSEKELRSKETNYFSNLVEKALSNVLVTFKQDTKIVSTKINRLKKGKKTFFEQTENVTIPRGSLHKDSVFSQIEVRTKFALHKDFIVKEKYKDNKGKQKERTIIDVLKPEHIPLILEQNIKAEVENRLNWTDANFNKTLETFKKQPLIGKDKTNVKFASIMKKEFVLRYPLDKGFKLADVAFIVDKKIKEIVLERFEDKSISVADKFNHRKYPLFLDEAMRIPIRRVTLFTKGTEDAVRPLRVNEQGKPIDFVALQNNTINCIYKWKNEKGKEVFEEIVIPFYDAVRWQTSPLKKFGFAIKNPSIIWNFIEENNLATEYEALLKYIPKLNYTFVTSLQTNDAFVFNMTKEEIEKAMNSGNYTDVNKNLYRVQIIAKGQNRFRFHTETGVKDNPFYIQSTGSKLGAVKVKINKLGKIVKVGE